MRTWPGVLAKDATQQVCEDAFTFGVIEGLEDTDDFGFVGWHRVP